VRSEKEIRKAYNDYDTLKEIIENADQEISEVAVDLVRAAFDWVLEEEDED